MPFKQRFERKVNQNMKEDLQEGRAPRPSEDQDADLKKGFRSPQPPVDDEMDESMDEEMHEKRDRPPRFSTIFGAPPAPAPAPIQYIERPPRRRSGVFMPMPLFVLFIVIIFFESTILFAYTILGIYNNAGPRLFGLGGVSNCQASPQPFVNISPNFMMPGVPPQGVPVAPVPNGNAVGYMPEIVTTELAPTTSSTPSSTSTSTTDSPTSSSSSSSTTTTSSSSTTSTTSSTSSDSANGGIATATVSPSQTREIVTATVASVTVPAPFDATVTSVVIATGLPTSVDTSSILAAFSSAAANIGARSAAPPTLAEPAVVTPAL